MVIGFHSKGLDMFSRLEETFLSRESSSRKNPINFSLTMPRPKLLKSEILAKSKKYASVLNRGCVKEEQILSRNTRTRPADLINLRNWECIGLNSKSAKRPIEHILAEFQTIGIAQRSRDYMHILKLCDAYANRRNQMIGWKEVLGFVISIIVEQREEFGFYRICSKYEFNKPDLPYLLHFMNEVKLLSITMQNFSTCVLCQLNLINLSDVIGRRARLIPELCVKSDVTSVHCRELIRMNDADLPYLEPIGEGERPSSYEDLRAMTAMDRHHRPAGRQKTALRARRHAKVAKETNDITELIKNQKWFQASLVATEHLSRNPNDSEMYINRALCLIKLDKYADAVLDATKSLAIKTTDLALRIRAAAWIALGDLEMAQEDLLDMEDPKMNGCDLKAMVHESANIASRTVKD